MFRSTTTKLGVFVLACALAHAPSVARAQTQEELKQARELFQEAYKDEQEKRYAEALEKFRRVAAVKETPAVRYRIGATLEGSGKLREARDTFRALAAAKDQLKPDEKEIAASAAERVVDIDRRMPKLVVTARNPPEAMRLFVDGVPVGVSAQGSEVEIDPGDHVVAATAPGHVAFEEHVSVQEGARVSLEVVMTKETPSKDEPPPPTTGRNRTLGFVALGAGAALAVAGSALLVVREGDIDDIETICPNGACPSSRRADVEDARDRASTFGPLGVGLLAGGIVAAGVGIYFLARPGAPPSASLLARPLRDGAAFGLGGRF